MIMHLYNLPLSTSYLILHLHHMPPNFSPWCVTNTLSHATATPNNLRDCMFYSILWAWLHITVTNYTYTGSHYTSTYDGLYRYSSDPLALNSYSLPDTEALPACLAQAHGKLASITTQTGHLCWLHTVQNIQWIPHRVQPWGTHSLSQGKYELSSRPCTSCGGLPEVWAWSQPYPWPLPIQQSAMPY